MFGASYELASVIEFGFKAYRAVVENHVPPAGRCVDE